MERLEDRDEVVAARGLPAASVGGHQEMDAVRHALVTRARAGPLDRSGVDVDAVDARPGIVPGEPDRRPARAAADIGDAAAGGEARRDIGQRRDPLGQEVLEMRSVERLLGLDDVGAVVGPVDAGAASGTPRADRASAGRTPR